MTVSLKYALPNLLLLALFSSSSFAAITTKFETTRMKSTGGAGVGSVLLEEAGFLNPATLGLYEIGSLYLQRVGGDQDRTTIGGSEYSDSVSTLGAIVSDAKGRVGGSVGYFRAKGAGEEVTDMSASFGYPIGKKSAFGTTYRVVERERNGERVSKNKVVTLGVTHLINSSFSMGFVAIDPLQKVEGETRGIFGAQYVYKEFISLMFDMGADYTQQLSDSSLIRGALQFRFFKDFFLRAGLFNDKGDQEKGSGVGVSWVQPRLMLEAALKNTENRLDSSVKDRETSMSLSYRF